MSHTCDFCYLKHTANTHTHTRGESGVTDGKFVFFLFQVLKQYTGLNFTAAGLYVSMYGIYLSVCCAPPCVYLRVGCHILLIASFPLL